MQSRAGACSRRHYQTKSSRCGRREQAPALLWTDVLMYYVNQGSLSIHHSKRQTHHRPGRPAGRRRRPPHLPPSKERRLRQALPRRPGHGRGMNGRINLRGRSFLKKITFPAPHPEKLLYYIYISFKQYLPLYEITPSVAAATAPSRGSLLESLPLEGGATRRRRKE